jgi:hypothetical protein
MSVAQEPTTSSAEDAPDPKAPGGEKPPNGEKPPDGGNGQDGGWPTVPIRLFKEHPRLLAAIFLAIVAAVVLLAVLIPFPDIGAQPDGETPAIEPTNALVGAYLVRWGIVLVIVAFVGQLFMLIASSIKLEEKPPPEEEITTKVSLPDLATALVGALPGLIKVPAGIGVSLALIGAILLLGTAVAGQPDASPTPSPSAANEPRGSTVPAPDPSG